MKKRNPFPPEPATRPAPRRRPTPRASGPAPKDERARADAPTMPPPAKARDSRISGVQSNRRRDSEGAIATVDEVTADLSKDPRADPDE